MKRSLVIAAAATVLATAAVPLVASAGDHTYKKVRICHRDQGKPEWMAIEIAEAALAAHLAHQWGADIYPVPANGCPTVDTTTTTEPSTTTTEPTTTTEATTTTTEPTTTTEATTTTTEATTSTTQPNQDTTTTAPPTTADSSTTSTTTPSSTSSTEPSASTTTLPEGTTTTTEPVIDYPLIASDCVEGRWIAMNLDTITVDVVQNGVTTELGPNEVIFLTRGQAVYILDGVQPYAFELLEPEDCPVPGTPAEPAPLPQSLPATR